MPLYPAVSASVMVMVFDFPTLVAITVFTSGLVGCLLLLSWLQHRRIFALALWGSAFIIAAIATTLIIARGTISDFWSIVIGNAILAAAYGIIWSGVRNFEGKRVSVVLTLAGVADLARRLLHRPDLRAAGSPRYRDGGNCHHLRAARRPRTLARDAAKKYRVGRSCCSSSATRRPSRSVFRLPDQRPIPIPST